MDGAPKGMAVLTNISGSTITYGDVGGRFAEALEREGEAAAVDFALENLRGIFGSAIDKHLVKAVATAWGQNPLVMGAYASAAPGKYHLRKVLRTAVGERLYFAGEACSQYEWATVSGAHQSGIETATKLAKALKAR
ncbi:MAG: FAD-dependent oxidoreductase [Kiloniellales bacterium]